MEQNPFCYFCKKEVRVYPHKEGIAPKDNTATIEHLKTKHEREKGEYTQKVLACLKCNMDRGMKLNKAIQLGKNIWKINTNWFVNLLGYDFELRFRVKKYEDLG